MHHPADLPLDGTSQHAVARAWETLQRAGDAPDVLRPVVRDSWARALRAQVRPQLPHAPQVWTGDDLERARRQASWLPLAERALRAHEGTLYAGGHVLTLFDRSVRMLHCAGDPHAMEGLKEINFSPGALWSEQAVGTNGPGTAVATGQPVHIVGMEHFCEGWQSWHCAAAPVRDPLTGNVEGVVDLSGFREAAHPHTLGLVRAVVVALEQMLRARELERRARLLARYAEMAGRWPGDGLVAVDRSGRVLVSSSTAPAALHPLAPLPEHVQAALADLVETTAGTRPRETILAGLGGMRAVVHPVMEEGEVLGLCLLLPRPATSEATRAARGRSAGTRYSLDDLLGASATLAEARRVAVAAAANSLPVLLLGESGTGKEMFAQGIHAGSARSSRPFVAVNCAALPGDLVESELFGYVGGAFTGARRDGGIGKFEAADGGTLFLDEVAELPAAAQAALLRVLQEGEVTRVGAVRGTRVDVRIIAATNRDIRQCLRDGTFREDLYYRLGVLTLSLPALRERRADVAELAERFLAEAEVELGRSGFSFSPAAMDALRAYAWPGNIREMRNVVSRTAALARRSVIGLEDLPDELRSSPARLVSAPPASGQEPRTPLETTGSAGAGEERARLIRAIENARNMGEAAEILGVARSTLYRQLERHGLRAHRVVRRGPEGD